MIWVKQLLWFYCVCLLCLYWGAQHLNDKTSFLPQIHFINQALGNQRFLCIHFIGFFASSGSLYGGSFVCVTCFVYIEASLPILMLGCSRHFNSPISSTKKEKLVKSRRYIYMDKMVWCFPIRQTDLPEFHSVDKTVKECHSLTTWS